MFFKNLGFCKKSGCTLADPIFSMLNVEAPSLLPQKGERKALPSSREGQGVGYFTTTFFPFWMNTPFWAFTTR